MGRRLSAVAVAAGVCALLVGTAPPALASPGQIVRSLDRGATPEMLVSTILDEGVTVSGVHYDGSYSSAAVFTGMGVTGIERGIVLSTGYADEVVGPNTMPDIGGWMGRWGDADLSAIVADTTMDAVSLEFDFVPDGDAISFDFVFGSDEYDESVGGVHNDVLGIFIDGQNCAVVPGTDQPITLNTVNAVTNADVHIGNTDGSHDTQMDGFTTVLTCTAAVTAGQSHHMKIAIADTSDEYVDSWVLVQAGTLAVNQVPSADDIIVHTTKDTPVEMTFTGNDPEGEPLSYALRSYPDNAALDGFFPGPTLTVIPAPGFVGTTEFQYYVNDGTFDSEPATVTIIVDEPTPEPTPTPTPTPTPEPTPTPTPEPTPTPTPTPEPTPTPTPTPEPTPTPTPEPTPTPTLTPEPTPPPTDPPVPTDPPTTPAPPAPSTPPTGPALPTTGAEVISPLFVWGGLGAIALGGVVMLAQLRTRRSD